MNNKALQQKMEENRRRAAENPQRKLKSYTSPEQPRDVRQTRKKKEPTFPLRLTMQEMNIVSIALSIAGRNGSVFDLQEKIDALAKKVYAGRMKLQEIKTRIKSEAAIIKENA